MSKTKEIALRVSGVSKTFKLPHEKTTSLKSSFLKSFKKKSFETQQALNDINFEVRQGEFFGIVGRNGSGKSTLLKCIAGVYLPTTGTVKINGTLVPFIELGVGFKMELSGRDNVFLNGALLGFSRKEMESMYDEIVDFAELKDFMDQKLKNYSSGMQVRLAFSIAIRAKGDILLLDEVLAVGDSAFQQKCLDYFSFLKSQNKTIILVSHSMQTIEQFCDRAMLIEHSRIKYIGTSTDIAGRYEEMFLTEEAQKANDTLIEDDKNRNIMIKNSPIKLESTVFTQDGKATRVIKAFDKFSIIFNFLSNIDLPHGVVGVNIQNSQGQILFSVDTKSHLGKHVSFKKGKKLQVAIAIDNILTNGIYYVVLKVANSDDPPGRLLLHNRRYTKFSVLGVRYHTQSLTHPKRTITIN